MTALQKAGSIAPTVKRYLAVGWGVAGVSGVAATVAHYRRLATTHPYLAEAVAKAQAEVDPEISSTWVFPKAKNFQDFGYAETGLTGGRRLVVEAKKVATAGEAPPAGEAAGDERGWRFFWENPWEVKFAVARNFRQLQATISDLVFPGSEEMIGNFKWEISRLVVCEANGEEKILVGSPVGNFPTESPKSSYSRTRWQLITGSLVLGVAGFFARRRILQRRLRPSFAEVFVRESPLVENLIGRNFQVVAKKGNFGKTVIDGVLELRGSRDLAVVFNAARVGSEWKILKAQIPNNGRPLSLV